MIKLPVPRVRLLIYLALVGLVLSHSGCASAAKNFAEGWKSAPYHSAAKEHRGTAFKPIYGPDGAYYGYTQRVGKYQYQHAPDGTIIGVVEPLPRLEWEEHRDGRGLLVKKTLLRYSLSPASPRGATEPDTTILYHYTPGGEPLGTTTLTHKDGYALATHRDAYDRPFPPYAPIPWEQNAPAD